MVSITWVHPRSRNTKWKVPEIIHFKLHAVMISVMKPPAILLCLTWVLQPLMSSTDIQPSTLSRFSHPGSPKAAWTLLTNHQKVSNSLIVWSKCLHHSFHSISPSQHISASEEGGENSTIGYFDKKRPHSHSLYYSVCYPCSVSFLPLVVNLWLCLIINCCLVGVFIGKTQ